MKPNVDLEIPKADRETDEQAGRDPFVVFDETPPGWTRAQWSVLRRLLRRLQSD